MKAPLLENADMPATIVVVEDDPDIRSFVEVLLDMHGYQPILLASSIGAHTAIRATHPDLVITDLEMGDRESGMQLLEALRADAATAHIPAILYSGNHVFLERNRAAITGLNAIPVAKPFEVDQLIRLVEAALVAA